jgi:hypothetical protein
MSPSLLDLMRHIANECEYFWDILQNKIPDLHHELLRIIALESDEQ